MLAAFTTAELVQLRGWQRLLRRWIRLKAARSLAGADSTSASAEPHDVRLPLPVWHGIGNDFQGSYELPVVVGEHRFRFTGKPTVGIVFIERTESLDLRRVARYD